ncbi:RING [Musa troglodytarum]|uniref:RING-type E3 ubiquitin transferase n=1 Tax=Musa troglodytarum TaxID=320322 RepID=A0A9E7FA87_9LILI|nr:RING [Musa troglodytarum]
MPPPSPIHSPGMAGQPPALPPPPLPPPPFVEQTKKVKNDVNVHKDSIRLVPDEQNPDHHLVSLTFDAMVDGRFKVDFNNSVTIYYFAKEGANASISSIYVDIYTPKGITFLKGPGQTFIQPSGYGIDLGFFVLDELSKPLEGDIFPLVIYAKSCRPSPSKDVQGIQSSSPAHAQITQAVIEKSDDGNFKVKVVKQILWVEGERYELQEIFGLSPVEAEINGGDHDDLEKECVICLSEPRDTTVLPCRHMCMCGECAKALRLQSNKCPICRQPVEQLMEIKVNTADP